MAQYKGAASEAGRAMHLMKKREKQREQMEQMKQRIAEVRAGPGPLKAGARTSAPTPPEPARPWAAGLSAGGGLGWERCSPISNKGRKRAGDSLLLCKMGPEG